MSSNVNIISIIEIKLDYSTKRVAWLLVEIVEDYWLLQDPQFQQECYLIIGSHLIFKLYHLKLI